MDTTPTQQPPHDDPQATPHAHARNTNHQADKQRRRLKLAQHKKWVREGILSNTSLLDAAAQHGVDRVTAWRWLRRPLVQRYMASLRRMQANQALQARIAIELSVSDAG